MSRGSAFQVIFFVALVVFIFYIVALQRGIFGGFAVESSGTDSLRGSLAQYAEVSKSYGYHSVRFSSSLASVESAEQGAGKKYWITYGVPNFPVLEQAREHLGTGAMAASNLFLASGLKEVDLGTVKIGDSGTVARISVLVDEEGLLPEPGKGARYDEQFAVASSGGDSFSVSSIGRDEQRLDQHTYSAGVNPNRFWYLYRVIRGWARENIPSYLTCSAMQTVYGVGSGPCCLPAISEATIDGIVKKSSEDLSARFDKYVKCEYEIIHKYALTTWEKTQDIDCSSSCPEGCTCRCSAQQGCMYSVATEPCVSGPCDDPHASGELECRQGTVPYDPRAWQPEGNCGNIDGSCYGFANRHEASFIVKFSCTDKKYAYPIDVEGFKDMRFDFYVHVFLLHQAMPPSPQCDVSCPMGGGGAAPQPTPSPPAPSPPGPSPPRPSSPPGPSGPGPGGPAPSPGPGPGPGPGTGPGTGPDTGTPVPEPSAPPSPQPPPAPSPPPSNPPTVS
ncbi:hypothetical protein HY640_04695 [Candidatus Woesearchaeota archaeon]|nr:hypothetical protein [Candidatus Woesearchaeota archaeon]